MRDRGSIGLICLLIVSLILIFGQSLYSMLATNYRYIKTYVRQRQAVYAVSSGIEFLDRVQKQTNTEIRTTMREELLPNDILDVALNTYTYNGVRWLVSNAKIADINITMVKGICNLPDATSSLYDYGIVSNVINIDPTASIDANSVKNYKTHADGSFLNFNPGDYTKYAFLPPETDDWRNGIGKNVFSEYDGYSFKLPSSKTIRGSGVFVSYNDIIIGKGSSYPDQTQFITNGNVIVEADVKLNNTFILAGMGVRISQGSRVSGKIFARSAIAIEKNTVIKDLPATELSIFTDKYVW